MENVQILLTSDTGVPGGPGNRFDTVGRHLTDHPEFRMGSVVPADPGLVESIGWYDVHRVDGAMASGVAHLVAGGGGGGAAAEPHGGWLRPGCDRSQFGVVEGHAATEQTPHPDNRSASAIGVTGGEGPGTTPACTGRWRITSTSAARSTCSPRRSSGPGGGRSSAGCSAAVRRSR